MEQLKEYKIEWEMCDGFFRTGGVSVKQAQTGERAIKAVKAELREKAKEGYEIVITDITLLGSN